MFTIISGLGATLYALAGSETLDITAVVQPAFVPGDGSSGSSGSSQTATVSLSGFAFPNARLTVLRDGQVATTLIANNDGTFRILINNLNFGNYQISLYAEDETGNSSATYTVNVSVRSTQPYEYTNIIVPPTLSTSTLLAEIGKPFYATGYAPAGSTVTLEVMGSGLLGSGIADTRGFYRIEARFTGQPGIYQLRAKAGFGEAQSNFSKPVQMLFYRSQIPGIPGTPGNEPPYTPPAQLAICVDYNGDGRVNLIDFSILLFWFGKASPPPTIDCNGDRVIDIRDFSILMYFWTG